MSYGKGSRPDLAERNRSLANREKVSTAMRGKPKHYKCGPTAQTVTERIRDKSLPVPWTGCWLWLGALDSDGYGYMHVGRKPRQRAHRVAYEAFRGPIPDGMVIDHLCRVRCCVNPDHLEAVTPRENVLRGDGFAAANARRTHCARGHALTVFVAETDPTFKIRVCVECQRANSRRRMREKKARQ